MAFSKAGALYTQSVTGTAGGIGAANVPSGASYAEGYVRTASVVETRDGATTPTATKGNQWDPGDIIFLRSDQEIDDFSAVRQASTSASIDWQFYTQVPSGGAGSF